MLPFFNDLKKGGKMELLNFMGDTPLVKIKNPYGSQYANVYVKLEGFNPGGSVKSRVGHQMIIDAEKKGIIKKGDTLIEATGGNTGIGLAITALKRGYNLKLVIPNTFSKDKINTLKEYGADVILSDHSKGNNSHLILTKEILAQNPEYICLDQFSNKSNPKAHYLNTGIEILNDMQNKIDYFVAGIGSGGTLMGVGKKLKEELSDVKIIGVEPEGCDILNNKFIPHKIQALAVGVISTFFDKNLVDDMIKVTFDEGEKIRKHLSRKEGIFVGISSGANVAAALKLSLRLDNTKNIITIAPDNGNSYLEYRLRDDN